MNKAILTLVAFVVTMLNLQAEETVKVLSGFFPIHKGRMLKYHINESISDQKIIGMRVDIEEPGVFAAKFLFKSQPNKASWTCRLSLKDDNIYYQLQKKKDGFIFTKNYIVTEISSKQGQLVKQWSAGIVEALIHYFTVVNDVKVTVARRDAQQAINAYRAKMLDFGSNHFWPVFEKLDAHIEPNAQTDKYRASRMLMEQEYDFWVGERSFCDIWPQNQNVNSEYLNFKRFNHYAIQVKIALALADGFDQWRYLLAYNKAHHLFAKFREENAAPVNQAIKHLHETELKYLPKDTITKLSSKLDVKALEER